MSIQVSKIVDNKKVMLWTSSDNIVLDIVIVNDS